MPRQQPWQASRRSTPKNVVLQPETSGILKLPSELLCDIFVACLPIHFVGISFAHAPLLLLQVCSLWRAVALDTPALWTTLDFTYPFNLDGPSTFKMWLKYSGSLPLTFIFETDDYSHITTEREVMQLLLANLCRFKILRGSYGEEFWKVLESYDGQIHAPLLEEFAVCDRAPSDEEISKHLDLILAPRLQKLILRGPWTFMALLQFQTNRLLEFSLTNVEYEIPPLSADELMDTLRASSNLRNLELEVCEEVCPHDVNARAVTTTLLRLRRLKLWFVPDCPQAVEFIRSFKVPNLRDLELRSWHVQYGVNHDWINITLELRMPRLRSIIIWGFDFTSYHGIQTSNLWSFSSLQSLEFDRVRISSALLNHLIPRPGRPWTLPNLRRLIFRNSAVPTWQEVLQLVRSRVSPEQSRRHIAGCIYEFVVQEDHVYSFQTAHEQVLEQLHRLTGQQFLYWVIRDDREYEVVSGFKFPLAGLVFLTLS